MFLIVNAIRINFLVLFVFLFLAHSELCNRNICIVWLSFCNHERHTSWVFWRLVNVNGVTQMCNWFSFSLILNWLNQFSLAKWHHFIYLVTISRKIQYIILSIMCWQTFYSKMKKTLVIPILMNNSHGEDAQVMIIQNMSISVLCGNLAIHCIGKMLHWKLSIITPMMVIITMKKTCMHLGVF